MTRPLFSVYLNRVAAGRLHKTMRLLLITILASLTVGLGLALLWHGAVGMLLFLWIPCVVCIVFGTKVAFDYERI